ncbi:hypothetical protein HMP0721_0531 [Pseudoramibacter alactolyticus ATCC 23263]|uniref:Uncharacterized protein n=1 Tax=Pseudoramibacter alactolyticus ATCC 23263 TaxID=887929 RepID=E6MEU8_9FIRM|nr:hypothetical protein HMP0721_0531 [Pseudoramibacter alactolyticus ATCC 23263]
MNYKINNQTLFKKYLLQNIIPYWTILYSCKFGYIFDYVNFWQLFIIVQKIIFLMKTY